MVASERISTVDRKEVNGADEKVSREEVGSKVASAMGQPAAARTVEMYDTTLRDGTQMEGISASVVDKLKISLQLHNFGR